MVGAVAALPTLLSGETIAPVVYGKVLFVGDSITNHGQAPGLNWYGHWGMAASAEEKDYVHVFLKKLADSQKIAPEHLVLAGGGGTLTDRVTMSEQMINFHPDLAVVQMGENDHDLTDERFEQLYSRVLQAIVAGNPGVKILCLGVWGPPKGSSNKDKMIRQACQENKAIFVDIGTINADPQAQAKSTGLYTHDGVQWHPSDDGMALYADALWLTLNHPTKAADSLPVISANAMSNVILQETWEADSSITWTPARPPLEKEDGNADGEDHQRQNWRHQLGTRDTSPDCHRRGTVDGAEPSESKRLLRRPGVVGGPPKFVCTSATRKVRNILSNSSHSRTPLLTGK